MTFSFNQGHILFFSNAELAGALMLPVSK